MDNSIILEYTIYSFSVTFIICLIIKKILRNNKPISKIHEQFNNLGRLHKLWYDDVDYNTEYEKINRLFRYLSIYWVNNNVPDYTCKMMYDEYKEKYRNELGLSKEQIRDKKLNQLLNG